LKNNSLVERLSLQSESFQEGFELLIKCNTLEEMIKNFYHLLRGNFLATNLFIGHKKSIEAEWETPGIEFNLEKIDFAVLNHKEKLTIKYSPEEKYDAVIALPLSDGSFLGIIIGNKLDKSDFNDFDKITLQILLQVFSSAYNSLLHQREVRKLIFDLNEKVLQLNNLIDTGIELSKFSKHDVLFELSLERAISITNSSSGIILITDAESNNIEYQYSFPPRTKLQKVRENPFKIESSFNFNNKHYQFVLSEKETRNGTTSFADLDVMLLDSIARQVQAAIENEHLVELSLEKERIEKELSLAASIQQRIIPNELPRINGYELAGINIPSREVGGDYYDCIDMGNGNYALIIADVAGKGISAALLVSTLNAALYSYLEFDVPLTELVEKLNKLIFQSSPSDKYITFFIAVLNSETGEMNIVNAGHNPALLLRQDGNLEQVEAGGIGLGMLDFGMPYTGQSFKLNSGDKFFLYTDGIPEAMNVNEEEYSDEKMIEFFQKNVELNSDEFVSSLVSDVKSFVGKAKQSDDITSIMLQRK
jgi:sigma-B regulation protein RsbU (phosphoserine phosphatase)